jgi:hypothetical protein
VALDEPYEGDNVVGEMVVKAFDDVAILASRLLWEHLAQRGSNFQRLNTYNS